MITLRKEADTQIVKRDKKTMLVTGGLGFIGGHFVEYLLEKGHNVVNIDKVGYASRPDLNNIFAKKYPESYQFIKRDVLELKELPYCNYIFHFAAESHVDNAIKDGMAFTVNNVIGTQNLLNLIIKTKSKNVQHSWPTDQPVFVYISTDEVFGDRKIGFFKEYDRMLPSNPYSSSKAAAELLVIAYNRTYGIQYNITRTTNNYGPRQHPEKLVPSCITNAIAGKIVKLHGTGEQIRNWIHVIDNCEAIYTIMTKGKLNEIYHISSDEEYSVNEVARIILEAVGEKYNSQTVMHIQDRAGQDIRYALDSSKLRKLGWKAAYSFKKEIKNIIEEYKRDLA